MKRYISPIGFSPHLVTGPIIANGISTGDHVDIIRPEQPADRETDRAANAIDDVKSTLSGAVNNIDIEVEIVATSDFESTINRCSEIIMDGPSPVICLGAGATDIHFPLTVATIAHRDHIVTTMMYSDLKTTTTEVDFPALGKNIPGRARETFESLSTIDEGDQLSIANLASMNDVSRPTIGRHIQELEKRGFVSTKTQQKEKIVSLTMFGQMIARNLTSTRD